MGNDPVRTRLFISTLKGVAFEWFRKLPKGSITCWEDLEALFLSCFFEKEADINMHTLLLTKQKEGDESMATKKREPIVVPVEPITRSRAKQFKERLNGLIHKIQQEGSGLHMEGDQKPINIIQVTLTHIDQLVQDGIQVRSN